jgi:hypothetical protein
LPVLVDAAVHGIGDRVPRKAPPCSRPRRVRPRKAPPLAPAGAGETGKGPPRVAATAQNPDTSRRGRVFASTPNRLCAHQSDCGSGGFEIARWGLALPDAQSPDTDPLSRSRCRAGRLHGTHGGTRR